MRKLFSEYFDIMLMLVCSMIGFTAFYRNFMADPKLNDVLCLFIDRIL